MRCPSCQDLFSERFDARLSAADAASFDAHLAGCVACAAEYAAFARVFDAVRALGPRRPAPSFRRPPELPAARPAAVVEAPAESSVLRFVPARAAAAVLLVAALGVSHSLVFRYGRDVASGPEASRKPVAPPEPFLASSVSLPSRLRDHVDATDLFLRTAAQMPADSGARGRELLAADFERLGLAKLTEELREPGAVEGTAHVAQVRSYLAGAAGLFDRLGAVFADPSSDLEAVRATAVASPVTRELAQMRPLVLPVGSGDTFRRPRPFAKARLGRDERALFASRDARLAGDYSGACDGFQKFGSEFRGSALKPLADYLLAEAYARSGNYAPVAPLLAQLEEAGARFLPNDDLAPLVVMLDVERLGRRMEVRVVGVPRPFGLRLTPPAADRRAAFVAEPADWDEPDNVSEFCAARGLKLERSTDLANRPVFRLVRNGAPLAVAEHPELFAAVKALIQYPEIRASAFGAVGVEPPAAAAPEPATGRRVAPVVR